MTDPNSSTIETGYVHFPNPSSVTGLPVDFLPKFSLNTPMAPSLPLIPSSDIWRERVRYAAIIGFLKGCLEGLRFDISEDRRAKIDAALEKVEKMESSP